MAVETVTCISYVNHGCVMLDGADNGQGKESEGGKVNGGVGEK